MTSLGPLESLALELVETRSPSDDEGPALVVAERALREASLSVERQQVGGPERYNLFAWRGRPRVVLTTHLDTVPGDPPVRIGDDVLHGRGSCDAKGIAAAMISAADALASSGREDFGVLLVVGEETTSDGAIAANELISSGALGWSPEACVFGEPTGLSWVTSHPGVVMVTIQAQGEAGHSSRPDAARSATHALLDALERIRREAWPGSDLGETRVNIGRLEGGSAANVIAESARADVMFRGGADPEVILRRLRELMGEAELLVTCSSAPVRFAIPDGAPSHAAWFSTDAPFLPALGRPFLFGPGDIRHAHAAGEHVRLSDLRAARDAYVDWVTTQASSQR
jgi:acetylornithine deacetylase